MTGEPPEVDTYDVGAPILGFLAARGELVSPSQVEDSLALRDAIWSVATMLSVHYGIHTPGGAQQASKKRLVIGDSHAAVNAALLLERFGCVRVIGGALWLMWDEVRKICE